MGGDGRLQEVGANVPRVALRREDSGFEMRGYLAEGAAQNQRLWSSFESSPGQDLGSWSPQGEVVANFQKWASVHGDLLLELAGAGAWLYRQVPLAAFAAPDFGGYFPTAFVRTKDGKLPAHDLVQVYATRTRGGPMRFAGRGAFRIRCASVPGDAAAAISPPRTRDNPGGVARASRRSGWRVGKTGADR